MSTCELTHPLRCGVTSPCSNNPFEKCGSPPSGQEDFPPAAPGGCGGVIAPCIDLPRTGLDVEGLILAVQAFSEAFGTNFQNLKLEQVKNRKSELNDTLKKNLENFSAWVRETAKQIKAQEKQKVFGWISKIATLIVGVAVMAAAGAALVAAPMTVAGAALFFLAGLSAVTSAFDLAGDIHGKEANPLSELGVGAKVLRLDIAGLFAEAAKASGADEKVQSDWAIAGTAFQLVGMLALARAAAPGTLSKVATMTNLVAAVGAVTSGTSHICHGAISLDQIIPAREKAGNLKADMTAQEAKMLEPQKFIERCYELIQEVAEALQLIVEKCAQVLSDWADSMIPDRIESMRAPVMA